jgi:hypothetical protein
MKKWELIHRNGIGAFGYEIYQNTQDIERFLIKIFVYDKPVLLSGTREIIGNKIDELKGVLEELSKFFPTEPPPF